ncbi:MAG: ABC transporter ATP-binding protein [Bacteroidetes bacterium]|nr:MAG: ABC transporter ATP-binding protein [Bacteroidota bacterium]
MLQATGLEKSYGKLKVLNGVDISIQKGEMVAITGPSGAGKSTLLQILGTLDLPDTGNFTLDNVNVTELGAKKLAAFRNKNIGFVFQFHNLLPEFTALENICIPAFIAGTDEKLAKKNAEELLKLLGIAERANHKPSELSGGEQQRVAVARALMNNPKIIFADEPSGNLDSKNAEELHQLFVKLKTERQQTFVIVTHNEQLAAMADRWLTMKDGQLAKN